jgi:metallo-beta-lactamase class B
MEVQNVTRNRERYRVTTVVLGTLLAVMVFAGRVVAQNDPSWTESFPPFHIAGNLYYVGSKGLANYLITTPQGHILINSDLEANVP